MACVNCGKIRSAILHGKMAEAAGITIEVLREKIGLAPKDEAKAEQPAEGEPSKALTKAR